MQLSSKRSIGNKFEETMEAELHLKENGALNRVGRHDKSKENALKEKNGREMEFFKTGNQQQN